MKHKITTSLSMLFFLVSMMVVATRVNAVEPGESEMIDLIANGEDINNPLNKQFIMAKIKYDEDSELYLAHVEFHIKFYDESGQKSYSMKGKLKDGAVARIEYYDPNLFIYWVNCLWVVGEGVIKDTSTGQYFTALVGMLASTSGSYWYWQQVGPGPNDYIPAWGESEIGPWAWAGIWFGPDDPNNWGVTTIITKYIGPYASP